MILNLDCRHGLAMLPDNSVDAIVCDPMYGLGKEPDALAMLQAWMNGKDYVHKSKSGFMGKEWDAFVPQPSMWRECWRVLKPGGYLLAFAGTRTQHLMALGLQISGFEIRDMIAWVYGSGYPKHRSSLKLALEPITMARKPAERATLLNIDACRVGDDARYNPPVGELTGYGSTRIAPKGEGREVTGRYPSNLLHDGSDEVLALFPDSAGSGGSVPNVKISGYGDGAVGTGSAEYLGGERTKVDCGTGSAARFFYCAKAGKRDRNEGLEHLPATSNMRVNAPRSSEAEKYASVGANPHPTVKPTELMRYLCRLVTPPGGLIVDPFAGSGSTGKAAILEGFQFVGFELDPQYTAIANARLEATRNAAS